MSPLRQLSPPTLKLSDPLLLATTGVRLHFNSVDPTPGGGDPGRAGSIGYRHRVWGTHDRLSNFPFWCLAPIFFDKILRFHRFLGKNFGQVSRIWLKTGQPTREPQTHCHCSRERGNPRQVWFGSTLGGHPPPPKAQPTRKYF